MPSVCLVGVDIGGTKTKAAVVETNLEKTNSRVLLEEEVPTPKLSPRDFYDSLAALIQRIRRQLDPNGPLLLPLAAIAHPGRFLPDGTLARGTTPNIGIHPHEFDGINPALEMEKRLGGFVVAENDAVAQMRFGLHLMLSDSAIRVQLIGETVVYLGPGTGMGGGVACIDRQGNVTPITDGHLFDMQVEGVGDGTLTAEEIFTGPAIARDVVKANAALAKPVTPPRGGSLDEILLSPGSSAEHRAVAQKLAEKYGEILAHVITTVYSGKIVKVRLEALPDGKILRHRDEPDRAWSLQDQEAVRGAKRFLFGGFLGCSRGLGSLVRQHALRYLDLRGLTDVQIIPIPSTSADAGVLGIVTAIPADMLRRVYGKTRGS